jgi:putative membrane-bound dehydrogenase-like protein
MMPSQSIKAMFLSPIGSLSILLLFSANQLYASDDRQPQAGYVHQFQRQALTSTYFSEGVGVGDLNNDGHPDIVYGPYWFQGPDFNQRFEIYPAQPQPMRGYTKHFFSWVYDFDQDGWNDVLVVGFPGTAAFVYQNPGEQPERGWQQHQVFDWVSNESPAFLDLTGDGIPELLCTREGYFGFAKPKPGGFQAWEFQRISNAVAPDRFGHGLGAGDIDGDGRLDVLTKDGWFQQPETLDDRLWKFHPFPFADVGGAEMYAYDVNGDGLNDLITSLDGHGFGLAWFEQTRDAGGQISFRRHLIMGSRPSENPFGLHFSELHSVALADIDGDGLLDIVTGKTYWSHHEKSPDWDAGAVVYWFQLKRTTDGVEWIPHLMDDQAGIGRQIAVADLNGDGLPEVITGGMLGCHVLHHARPWKEGIAYTASIPQPRRPLADGLSGQDAARQMTVPQGFHVQLAAAEPDVHQPVAMAIDHRGRVWIAEAYNYPRKAPEGEGQDRIIILEDTNHDGTLDHRKVFIENLNLVSGLEVGMGGVWVGAAPHLLFVPDRDGDDIPDQEPIVLLDGFGYQDTHETLNGFNWGPDGWLYGCHGVFTHSRVGQPGTPDSDRVPLNAGFWRYHPTRHQFEVFAWGTSNPWGIDFNDYGQAFATACVIPHLFHVIQGGRYHRQAGQHFDRYAYDDLKTIADHAHYAGQIGDHAWWGHEPVIQSDTSDAGGGHAHCGAMIYLGDNWPERFRNSIFMHNIHGNRVNVDRLVRKGSGYLGRHADDLLLANDKWFRGINLRYGPDGSVYLIDWYDKNACHRINPEIWDRSNGRVYRISYGVPDRQPVDLEQLDDRALAELIYHRNDWFVRVSRRILQQRAAAGQLDRDQVLPLLQAGLNHSDPTRVLRALWLGHATGLWQDSRLVELLGHPSPYVVGWAIQLLAEDGNLSSDQLQRLTELAADPGLDPAVRLALTSAIQRIPLSQRWSLVEKLVMHAGDANDQNLPLMIWYGMEPLVEQDPGRAVSLMQSSPLLRIQEWIARRAAANPQTLDVLLGQINHLPGALQGMVLGQILASLEGNVKVPMPSSWQAAYEQLQVDPDESIKDRADRLAVIFGDRRVFPSLRGILSDSQRTVAERRRALDILVQGRDGEALASLFAALETPELQSAAIRALASYDDPQIPRVLLAAYPNLATSQREDAVATLAARVPSAHALMDAIAAGIVPGSEVHAYHIRQMTNLLDPQLVARIEQSWGKIAESSSQQQAQIAAFKTMLTPELLQTANLGHGRLLYQRICASCHRLFGEGEMVGPDLTGSDRANLDYILENIVAPDSIVGRDYQMSVLLLDDGRVVSGLVTRETETALTVRTINDSVVIPLDGIEDRRLSELSLMPSGLIDPLTEQERRDLIGYLASPKQVPLRGPAAPIDPVSGLVPGAIEGEGIAVQQITAGTANRQEMSPFKADRWSGNDQLWWTGGRPGDRLTVVVEVPETGNYQLETVFTMARDYGIVQLYLNQQPLGQPLDLFNESQVISTGVLTWGQHRLDKGTHQLTIQLVGSHPQAVKSYMVGLDYVRLTRVTPADGS